jgi:carbamoyltransferase
MRIVYIGATLCLVSQQAACFTTPNTVTRFSKSRLYSTPFEAGYYDDESYLPIDDSSSLAVPPDTKLVLGLNKYSHDTTLCAADSKTGEVLFAVSKERLTRRKHDSGNVAVLVEACLECLDLDFDAIEKVVVNNHHHRVLPIEKNRAHLEWESGLGINGGAEVGYDDEENLLSNVHELSHHLAHAYSAATQSPFDSGMIVVMDGMGETFRAMLCAEMTNETSYTSDLSFGLDSFQCIPSDLKERSQYSHFDFREAESVYVFEKKERGMDIRPVFKRFTEENSPPTLYNHGFENMDSAGALYSRASSHIFGDWNACGKVMGLAPWMVHSWDADGSIIAPRKQESKIMWGTLYSEEEGRAFQVDRSMMVGTPFVARNDADLFDDNMVQKRRYDFDDNAGASEGGSDNDGEQEEKRLPAKVALDAITLSHRIQVDLEDIVIDFVKHFKAETGETNLCLAGGVALNSVLNGRLCRELGFEQTFIPPYPGDDGIAVGCCAYGLYGNAALDAKDNTVRPPIWNKPLSPYLGPNPSELEIKEAIKDAAPWLDVEAVRNEDRRLEIMAQEIESGGVVAWYHSRSELGPRALGHRSILADPRKKGLVRFINEHVKNRESFRPFAPSVLAEEASNWFDLGDNMCDDNVSPFMSLTAYVKKSKRAQIPAVTHVDGSSRLQTVTKEAEPLYHKLISTFFGRTGVPLVLNTSFNTLPGEPIVETPKNAIRSFLCSMGSIEMLVMGDYIIKRKRPSLRTLLGEALKEDDALTTEPTCPKRAGPAYFESRFVLNGGQTEEEDVVTKTRVRMPARPMNNGRDDHFELLDELEGEILSVCDGTNQINDIMGHYTARPQDEELTDADLEDSQVLFENIARRLIRLYEHTLISW